MYDAFRSKEARQAEGQQRFMSGYKHGHTLPYTLGLRAHAFAAMCPNLRVLSIDERASCLGGLTNDLARALAVHCPLLSTLEVFFERYSLPSAKFSDEGLIALSESCHGLKKVTLHNCDQVSDRSLYALAANCAGLKEITIAGYNENVTDGGLCILFERCHAISRVKLSSKLLKVTDISIHALAAHCKGLVYLKMSQQMTDVSLQLLACNCKQLQEVDMHRCSRITQHGLWQLLVSCCHLTRLVLPADMQLGQVAQHVPHCRVEHYEQEQLQELLVQQPACC